MNTKEVILQSSINLMYQKGYFGTSVNEIAKSSNIKKATFYDYYPSKDALLRTILMRGNEQWIEQVYRPYLSKAPVSFLDYLHAIENITREKSPLTIVFLLAQETAHVIPGVYEIIKSIVFDWMNALIQLEEIKKIDNAYYHIAQWIGLNVLNRIIHEEKEGND